MSKERMDKIINGAAVLTGVLFLAGILIAIWIGAIGIKIALSALVAFAGDFLLFYWTQKIKKENGKKEKNYGGKSRNER